MNCGAKTVATGSGYVKKKKKQQQQQGFFGDDEDDYESDDIENTEYLEIYG